MLLLPLLWDGPASSSLLEAGTLGPETLMSACGLLAVKEEQMKFLLVLLGGPDPPSFLAAGELGFDSLVNLRTACGGRGGSTALGGRQAIGIGGGADPRILQA